MKLGNVFKLSSGKSLPEKKRTSGIHNVYGGNGITGNHNEYFVDNPTIVIGRVGEYCGAVHLTTEKCWVTDNALMVTNWYQEIDKKYLVYMLNAMNLHQYAKTVGQPSISQANIYNLDVDLPLIARQEEIVKVLDSVNEVIKLRKQQLQQLDELVKARFVELMNTNYSYNLLSDFITSYKAERCGDRDLPVLSITKDDGIVLQNEKFKKRIASVDASTYKVVPRGKLVQGIHIDERNFAIQNIVDEGIVSPAYKIWTVDTTKAVPEVLAFALRTDRTMAYISSKFTGSVKRRESISLSDFMATPIDLPNMSIQKEFAAFVEQIDKSKVAVQKALDEAQTLFDSLMQKYFG